MPNEKGGYSTVGMHRVIMDAKKGQIVDHIDGRGLNNTRNNLRIVTASQNAINRKIRSDNSSNVVGVSLDKKKAKWIARITVDGKKIKLGEFKTLEEAVEVRKKAEKEHFGEYYRRSSSFQEAFVPPSRRDTSLIFWHLLGYGDVYVVPLTKDKYSIIDVSDYDAVYGYTWCFSSPDYASGYLDKKMIFLHRFLMNPADGIIVDHINGDGLDNRRCNFRFATSQQNCFNTTARTSSSGHKSIRKVKKSFEVSIGFNGKLHYLGRYKTLEKALEVRNIFYAEHHGEYARYD